jgi:hypothetical protein
VDSLESFNGGLMGWWGRGGGLLEYIRGVDGCNCRVGKLDK